MLKKILKGSEVKFLYTGIVLLLIIAIFLIFILFSIPSSPFGKIDNQPQPTFDAEQVHTLLSAPTDQKPVQIPPTQLKNLEGTKERVVPTQEMMNMLSAPPPQN